MNIYVHYGQNRPKEASLIGQSDIVLTTYGVVSSEFSIDVSSEIFYIFTCVVFLKKEIVSDSALPFCLFIVICAMSAHLIHHATYIQFCW